MYLLSRQDSFDWAGDTNMRKSITDIAMMIERGPVAYSCNLHRAISYSSTETEFVAAAYCTQSASYIISIIKDPLKRNYHIGRQCGSY